MKVVVVGGSGLVGSMTVPVLERHHDVLVFDPFAPSYPTEAKHVAGTLGSSRQVADAMKGADALVYMAMGQRDGWSETTEWEESHFDVNVKWLWTTMSAASRQGVTRVVHLSTMSIFADYLEVGSDEGAAPDAVDVYGLTKRLAEVACAAMAGSTHMSVVSLRLVGPMTDAAWAAYDDPALREVVTAGSDVAAAVEAGLAVDLDPGAYRAFPISGDWRQSRVAMHSTDESLGWRPRARRDESHDA